MKKLTVLVKRVEGHERWDPALALSGKTRKTQAKGDQGRLGIAAQINWWQSLPPLRKRQTDMGIGKTRDQPVIEDSQGKFTL